MQTGQINEFSMQKSVKISGLKGLNQPCTVITDNLSFVPHINGMDLNNIQ